MRDGDQQDEGEIDEPTVTTDRVWLIQCKREKSLGPAKMRKYLEKLPTNSVEGTSGIVFVAACDFSLKTREAYREVTRALGFAEAYLWGKGEIEDQLFQPRNDHLLFAYFGISLRIRQRSIKTEVRAKLAMKRKVKRHLNEMGTILIRDASDTRYPWIAPDTTKERYSRGRFRLAEYVGCFHDGVHVLHRRSMAFLDKDGVHWDYAETYNHGYQNWRQDPWGDEREEEASRQAVTQIWNALDPEEKGWIEVKLVLPYESILDIDEDGDDVTERPHVFVVQHRTLEELFQGGSIVELRASDAQREIEPKHANRMKRFPRKPVLPSLPQT